MKGLRLGVFATLVAALLLSVGSAAAAPDPSFGQGGGIMTFLSTEGSSANALVLQPDGKLVAVGTVTPPQGGPEQFALVRYLPDGSVDSSFGSDGVVETPIPGGFAEANAAALQPDGKIVVAGDYLSSAGSEFALARYNADGLLDAGFGSGGIVTTQVEGVDSKAFGLVLQPDGKIVAGGDATSSTDSGSAVVRYLPNGSPDPSFGTGGIAFSTQPGENGFDAVALQPDGKILGVGQNTPLTRFNTDGSPDTSFGSGGISVVAAPKAAAIALQADGRIVVAGGTSSYFVLVRANSDGSADQTFGTDALVATPMGRGPAGASAVAIQPDGKIVAAGTSQPGSAALITVARYNQDGSLDSTFGTGGVAATLPRGTVNAGVASVALQADGKIDVAGWAEPLGWVQAEFGLARFLVTPTLTVSKNASGSGSVTSNPAGINCGASCFASFTAGSVTLTPTPGVGSVFAGWSGSCSGTGTCTVALSGDKSVTATFDVAMNTLSVTRGGKGRGTVASSPSGIACGSTCGHAYAYGTAVTLVARPARGSVFRGWSGACSGTRKTCSLTMSRARSARAVFQPKIACIVPKLRGRSLRTARHRIRLAHCRTGKVGHRHSRMRKGRVIAQTPPPGRHLRAGSRVNVVVSSGRRR
jgi:uncharacterized delta-60 repeat protein